MAQQSNLFDDEALPSAPTAAAPEAASGAGIVLSALNAGGGTPSAEQQRFNRLLERTEALAGRITAAQALADAHRQQCATSLHPLELQQKALMRDLALWLDGRLARSGLTRTQQRIAGAILCQLAAALALDGDQAMRELHDAHAAVTLDEAQKEEADATQSMLEELLGEELNVGDTDDDPEAMLRAGLEQLRAQDEARERERDAARARHKATRARSAGKKQALRPAEDAEGTLRTIFRQLASALHPDREADPQARLRKTALMSEANAAYGRRDLLALLKLQVHLELADGHKLATLARERIAALSLLLKERADWLARELLVVEATLRQEFALPPYVPLTEAGLRRHLRESKDGLLYDIGSMQQDLRLVRDDSAFKRWLREQDRLARQ